MILVAMTVDFFVHFSEGFNEMTVKKKILESRNEDPDPVGLLYVVFTSALGI